MSRPALPISVPATAAWHAYRDAVKAERPRAEVRAAMERFLAVLTPADHAPLTAWFFRARYGPRRSPNLAHSFARLLLEAVLVPELLAGAAAGRPDHLRWLVRAMQDADLRLQTIVPELFARSRPTGLLAAALVRNPEAPDLWGTLFWRELDVAFWGGHHMDEGSLVLPEARCRAALRSARQIAAAAPAGALDDDDLDELADLERCFEAFFAWRDGGKDGPYDGPIPRWVPFPPPVAA